MDGWMEGGHRLHLGWHRTRLTSTPFLLDLMDPHHNIVFIHFSLSQSSGLKKSAVLQVWAQTEFPSGCGAASPSQGPWDPDSLRPASIRTWGFS